MLATENTNLPAEKKKPGKNIETQSKPAPIPIQHHNETEELQAILYIGPVAGALRCGRIGLGTNQLCPTLAGCWPSWAESEQQLWWY